jgi:hypothetical protein
MSFFGQQFPDHQAGAVGLGGIELRLFADADVPLFEARQDFALGGRLHAPVFHGADDRVFLDLEDDNFAAARAVVDEELGVERIEEPHLNDGLKVALSQAQVETILRFALDVIKNRFAGNATIAANLHVFHKSLRRLRALRQRGTNRNEHNNRYDDCVRQKVNASGHESSPIEQC